MRAPTAALGLALLLAFASCTTAAKTYTVNWFAGKPSIPGVGTTNILNIKVGDTVKFQWFSTHDLWLMPGTVCNKNNKGVKKAGPSGSGSWSFTFRAVKPSPGWTYGCYIQSGATTHCAMGQRLQVIVKPAVGRKLK
ncbi:expressed protein [Chlorella variabilis]|uniref:Expressed protein n=1 Tax=Chlorella variabilis TaxID=554065 RepID=E1Z3J6_CHLVA|nr:expressed protein [Chlorella variabilis]EFN60172.1 expressed protein [Chlorella variabilis]|eukprot:XP_005852274.1 expressed protein [Chlorella variabilis]